MKHSRQIPSCSSECTAYGSAFALKETGILAHMDLDPDPFRTTDNPLRWSIADDAYLPFHFNHFAGASTLLMSGLLLAGTVLAAEALRTRYGSQVARRISLAAKSAQQSLRIAARLAQVATMELSKLRLPPPFRKAKQTFGMLNETAEGHSAGVLVQLPLLLVVVVLLGIAASIQQDSNSFGTA